MGIVESMNTKSIVKMNTSRKILLIIIFTAKMNLSNGNVIRIQSPLNISIIDHSMVNIIEKCLPDVRNILFGGSHDPETIKNMNNLYPFATVRLSNLSVIEKLRYHQKKIDLLVLDGNKLRKFLPSLEVCQNLRIANNEVMVFVICKKLNILKIFTSYFSKLWKCRFLTSYVFYLNSKNKLKIYTFNPYSDRKIYNWNEMKLLSIYPRKKFGKRWTLYYRPYLEENICQGFNFDRTKYLDGNNVTAISGSLSPTSSQQTKELIEKALNIKVLEKIPFLIQKNGSFYHEKLHDFTLTRYHPTDDLSEDYLYSFSHPRKFYSIIIVTHNRGLLTPMEKIYNYYGFVTVISTIIILAITFIVIYLTERDLTFASFEIIRLLINTEILTSMKTTSSRIFFSMIFLYFLIIHGTFSGRLAGFLTNAEYRENSETLEDLKDSRYKQIYAPFAATDYIIDEEIRNKTIFGIFNCKNVIENNNSVACIGDYHKLLPAIKYLDLHVIKKPLLTGYYSHLMRKNWPMASRFNDVMIWCQHSGLSDKWSEDEIAKDVRQIKVKKARSLISYRPVTFDDLRIFFLLLGIGLILSIVAFIFEIMIAPKNDCKNRKKIKRVRIKRGIPIALIEFRIRKLFMKSIYGLFLKKYNKK